MTKKELKSVVRQFRDGILLGRSSERMCFMVCAPLVGYLRFLGVACELIEGDYVGSPHCWIRLQSGQIIDPTADQFNGWLRKMPKVYLGDLQDGYQGFVSKLK